MVDMHMHTIYSDGDKSVVELLKMCEEKRLEYISITDHNTCKQYDDEALQNNNFFNGKIIKGTELNAIFQNKNIEILAYNINPSIINEWCEKYYSEDKLREEQKLCRKRLLEICDKHGLIYDESNIRRPEKASEYVEIAIYEELMAHEENHKILGDFIESYVLFFRKGLANAESSYFMNYADFRPHYKEVIDIIHKAGGLAFLAHPFEYKFEDTIGFINKLQKDAKLDGLECYHPSAEVDNKHDILVKYARQNNLFISGGSDYHGMRKPDIEIGIGNGNLNIPKTLIEEWAK